MKALILAAGYATRLYPLTKNRAKPLLPIKGTPIINYIIKRLEPIEDIDKIYVVTNQKFYNDFCQWKDNYKFEKDIEIVNDETIEDETKLGAIGDIDFVIQKKEINEDLIIVAGDNLFDFNMVDFTNKAKSKKPAVSLGIYDVKEEKLARLYGIVGLDEGNKLIDFQEKPQEPRSTLAAGGIYFIPRNILSLVSRYLEEGKTPDEPGYFIRWLYKNNEVYGISLTGKWFDIGSVESYHRANGAWKEDK
jgi:glucose-1-phosphate thymidylyltransferase